MQLINVHYLIGNLVILAFTVSHQCQLRFSARQHAVLAERNIVLANIIIIYYYLLFIYYAIRRLSITLWYCI